MLRGSGVPGAGHCQRGASNGWDFVTHCPGCFDPSVPSAAPSPVAMSAGSVLVLPCQTPCGLRDTARTHSPRFGCPHYITPGLSTPRATVPAGLGTKLRGRLVPRLCHATSPRVFGNSSEQSNHKAIVLASAIRHEAAGTCRLLCGGMGRKPSLCRGGAASAGGALWQTQHPPSGTFPRGSRAAPLPLCSPAPGVPQARCATASGGMCSSPRVPCYPGKGKQHPKKVPEAPPEVPAPSRVSPDTACEKRSVKVAPRP